MVRDFAAGCLLPFFGTALGAFLVIGLKCSPKQKGLSAMNGFTGGVMTAAAVWSLLLPALGSGSGSGLPPFAKTTVGFWCGILFLITAERVAKKNRFIAARSGSVFWMAAAIVLHNIPEGMAVGAAFASAADGHAAAEALLLSVGIAVQNVPEGTVISLPFYRNGMKKGRAIAYGVLSGAVEPAAALVTFFLSKQIVPLLPYCLSFAAGAMLFVVEKDLSPGQTDTCDQHVASLLYCLGFTLMMSLDAAFTH